MRQATRKTRAFRPTRGTLEGRNPVSSLVPGPSSPDTADWQPTPPRGTAIPSSPRPSTPASPPTQPASFAQPTVVLVSAGNAAQPSGMGSTSGSSAPALPGSGSQALGNLAALAAPSGPSSAAVPLVAHPASPSYASPNAGGGAGVNTSSGSTQDSAASQGGGIRPMALAPSADTAVAAASVSPATTSGGSGGGSPPPPSPPPSPATISGGWGTASQLGGAPPNQTISNGVPIGAVMSFSLYASNGMTIDPKTIQWSGGTNYSSYYGGNASDSAPSTMKAQTNVNPNSSTYSFIVTPVPQSYDIKATYAYIDPFTQADTPYVTSELTFNSVAPTVSIQAQEGSPQVTTRQGTDSQGQPITGVTIQLLGPAMLPSQPAGMYIQATASTTTFGGSFMFLQVAKTERYVTQNGTSYWSPTQAGPNEPQGTGTAIDDAGPGQASTVGYQSNAGTIVQPTANPAVTSWTMGPNNQSQTTQTMNDSPVLSAPEPLTSLTVGNWGTDPGTPESYTTYVMYNPGDVPTPYAGGPSVWIGIAKVVWQWGARTTDGVTVQAMPNLPTPATTNPVTSPNDWFPYWTTTTGSVLSQGSNLAGGQGPWIQLN